MCPALRSNRRVQGWGGEEEGRGEMRGGKGREKGALHPLLTLSLLLPPPTLLPHSFSEPPSYSHVRMAVLASVTGAADARRTWAKVWVQAWARSGIGR
eukprot:362468-Chlamydomonas_euryale.AAC.5